MRGVPMSRSVQLPMAPRVCKALISAVLVFFWLGGAAATASLMAAGYVGLGAPALLALARVAARRYMPETVTANRAFPWIILWVIFDAVTLLGAGVLTVFGFSLTAAAVLTTPAWWASVPAILTLGAGIRAATPPIRSITRYTRSSRLNSKHRDSPPPEHHPRVLIIAPAYPWVSRRGRVPIMGRTESCTETIVMVVGKGLDAYRGYSLEELKAAGKAVWLVDDEVPSPSENHGIDRYFTVDFSEAARQQALDLVAAIRGMNIAAGVCYIEGLLPWAADFFAILGVPFISAEQALLVRSKHRLRTTFEQAGLPTPPHQRGEQHDLLAAQIEYPVVIKPEFGYSSIGVELITSHEELVSYFDRENNVIADTYVVEGVIEGHESSIEGYARNGVITAAALTTKFKTPLPYFEELAQYSSRSIEVSIRQRQFFKKTIAALGISNSLFHCEFFEKNSVFTPVEVGARLAGDKIPYLHRRVTGRSMLLDYLGDDVVFDKVESNGLGIVFFVPKAPGVVSDHFPPEGLEDELGEHFFEAPQGKKIKVAPDDFFARLGFCLVEADSIEEFVGEANRRIALYERASGIDLHRIEFLASKSETLT